MSKRRAIEELDADLVVVGALRRRAAAGGDPRRAGAGDARARLKKLALIHPRRSAAVLVVGVGDPDELDAERLRVAAAIAAKRAAELEAGIARLDGSRRLPSRRIGRRPGRGDGACRTTASTAFARANPTSPPQPGCERLVLATGEPDLVAAEATIAKLAAEAANRARELQNLPSNALDPEALAARAREIARRTIGSRSRCSIARRSERPAWAVWSRSHREPPPSPG